MSELISAGFVLTRMIVNLFQSWQHAWICNSVHMVIVSLLKVVYLIWYEVLKLSQPYQTLTVNRVGTCWHIQPPNFRGLLFYDYFVESDNICRLFLDALCFYKVAW